MRTERMAEFIMMPEIIEGDGSLNNALIRDMIRDGAGVEDTVDAKIF